MNFLGGWLMRMKLNHGFVQAFGTFLDNLREMVKKDTAGQVSPMGAQAWDVVYEEGYKYIRVVLVSKSGENVNKTAWGFVEKNTGDIFRAASWKAPCLNHTRGSIYDQDNGMKYAKWTGPAYIWEIDDDERKRVPVLSNDLKYIKKEVEEQIVEDIPELPEEPQPSPVKKAGNGMSIAAQIAAHIANLEGKIA